MDIAFGVGLEVAQQGVGRDDGAIEIVVECTRVDEATECAVGATYIADESAHLSYGGLDGIDGRFYACDRSGQVHLA